MSYKSVTPDPINNTNRILDMQRYNGRVNIAEPPSPDLWFKMQEKIAIKNKTTEYREA